MNASIVGKSLGLGMDNQHPGSLEEEIRENAIGDGGGEPSWGGRCPQTTIEVLDLQCNEKNTKEEWKKVIERATSNRTSIYTNGSKAAGTLGMVAGAWFKQGGRGLLRGYKQYTYIKLYKNNRYLQYLLEYVPHSSGYNN